MKNLTTSEKLMKEWNEIKKETFKAYAEMGVDFNDNEIAGVALMLRSIKFCDAMVEMYGNEFDKINAIDEKLNKVLEKLDK